MLTVAQRALLLRVATLTAVERALQQVVTLTLVPTRAVEAAVPGRIPTRQPVLETGLTGPVEAGPAALEAVLVEAAAERMSRLPTSLP